MALALSLCFERDERLVEGELLDELLLVLLQLTHVTRRLRNEIRDYPRDQEDQMLTTQPNISHTAIALKIEI